MATDYVGLGLLKASLGDSRGGIRDDLLQISLSAACRGIDNICNRRFWADENPVTRTYNPAGRRVCTRYGDKLLVDDIATDDGLLVEIGSGASWTPVTDYETGPDNALADNEPITELLLVGGRWPYGLADRVRITTRWGWPAIPGEVVQASLIQAGRLYGRKNSPEGIVGSPEWGPVRLARVDPDVRALIQHLILPGFA